MSEPAAIARSDGPRTRAGLGSDLRRLGLPGGAVVIVHTSMSRLGWVCGGAVAVVQALLDVLGTGGTLVAPTHTTSNSDPAGWSNPPVPRSWWPVVREHMPPFDPSLTPSSGVGVLPELVRTWPGARRSDHPQTSFAAIGPDADAITAGHALESGLGEHSPLARLYDHDAYILLLGAGHETNTSLHLAEYRVPDPPRSRTGAAIRAPEGRRWQTYEDIDTSSQDFAALGAAFDATGRTRLGTVGSAECRLMRQRDAVDFAVGWLQRERPLAR